MSVSRVGSADCDSPEFCVLSLARSFVTQLHQNGSQDKGKHELPFVKTLDHFGFNRHFLKSIFYLLTLNQFPYSFWHRTRWPRKNKSWCQQPTDPLAHILNFCFSPFRVLVVILIYWTSTSEIPQILWRSVKKPKFFPKI